MHVAGGCYGLVAFWEITQYIKVVKVNFKSQKSRLIHHEVIAIDQ